MSNGQVHPAMNAAQGMIGSSMGSGLLGQATIANSNLISTQQTAYNQAIARGSFSMSPRVSIEVDRVTNGYVMAVGSERMIAKDLEELQAQFIAQVVSKLVLEEGK
jgi:spore germination cell wall hydrolase CwlJ-like protein